MRSKIKKWAWRQQKKNKADPGIGLIILIIFIIIVGSLINRAVNFKGWLTGIEPATSCFTVNLFYLITTVIGNQGSMSFASIEAV